MDERSLLNSLADKPKRNAVGLSRLLFLFRFIADQAFRKVKKGKVKYIRKQVLQYNSTLDGVEKIIDTRLYR